tara:strand:+ start:67 stop:786 length:720 start_codon:yes stop_codon:yes gene_type:complete
MDCWLENLPIAYNLTENLTNRYFASDSQIIRFLGHALMICDQRYVSGYRNYIFHDLMHLSIKCAEENSESLKELIAQVIRSFFSVYEIGEYQWVFRVLWRMTNHDGYNVRYFNEVFDSIFKAIITPEISENLYNQYTNKINNCDLLADFFFILVESVVAQPPHDKEYFSGSTMRQCASTFLKFMTLVCEKETDAVQKIDARLNRSDNEFKKFHDNLKLYLDYDSLTKAEKQVLKYFENS